MKTNPTQAEVPETVTAEVSGDSFLTVSQLAEYLGLSRSAIYKLSSSHALPVYKPAKKIYFLRSEIDEWLRRHRIASQSEIERQAANAASRAGH